MPEPPRLRVASEYDEGDHGTLTWVDDQNAKYLSIKDDGITVEWDKEIKKRGGLRGWLATKRNPFYGTPPAWVPIATRARFHSGAFKWDFIVDEMQRAQIGVGFMLQWDQGLDWGFYGYLGAGQSAWSYDPSTGDVVTQTKSIAGGLPKFADGHGGVVSVRLELPRRDVGRGLFTVDGVESPPIILSEGAVVVPAACLLRKGQRVRLNGFTLE